MYLSCGTTSLFALPRPPLNPCLLPCLLPCLHPSLLPAAYACLKPRVRAGICSCAHSNFVHRSESDPVPGPNNKWMCGAVLEQPDRQPPSTLLNPLGPSPGSSTGSSSRSNGPSPVVTMEDVLPYVGVSAGPSGRERVVILVAVTMSYAPMLMNFVCNLRRLNLSSLLVIAALDANMYRFAYTHGLPVYYSGPQEEGAGQQGQQGQQQPDAESGSCEYGTDCFRKFTKLKSAAVLRVLKAGYSVLWTDVDIVWFSNPLPELMAYGPETLPVQSNEPNPKRPPHGIRRINSGFYLAHADNVTVAAFTAIVAHAAASPLSEQPSFYDILCGEHGQRKIRGKGECLWTVGDTPQSPITKRSRKPGKQLRTILLDRRKYANGQAYGYWEGESAGKACAEGGCVILHNNWIAGSKSKEGRMAKHGFWFYDVASQMCLTRPLEHSVAMGRLGGREALVV